MKKITFVFISALILASFGATTIAATMTSNATIGNWDAASTWTAISRTGRIAYTNGSTLVTGTGTSFMTELAVGSIMITTGGGAMTRTVASIASNTQLTLTTTASSTQSNKTFTAQVVPLAGDNVIIGNSDSIIVNIANAYCTTLSFPQGSASSLTMSGTNTLNVSGGVTIDRPANFNVNAGTLNAASLTIIGGTATNVARLNVTTGTVNITGSIAFTGTVSTLQCINFSGSGTLNVGGTFEADGTLTAGAGTINYTGTNQTIAPYAYNDLTVSGSGTINLTGITVTGDLVITGTATVTVPPTLSGLTINNSAGVTLNSPTTVNGTLTFVSGNLFLGTYDLTLSGAVSGAAAGRCVVTNSTGKVIRNLPPSTTSIFPVGSDGTHYNPVTLSSDASHTADDFGVTVTAGAVSPVVANPDHVVQATWNISESSAGGSSVIVTLGWAGSQQGTAFSTSQASIWHYNAGSTSWEDFLGSVVQGSDPYTLSTLSPVSSFSPFCVGTSGALPVEATSFTAESNGLSTQLRWVTATEVNSYNFEIERRMINTDHYIKVGTVQAAGISNAPRTYEFTDANVVPGHYIYRLKMNDNDGSFTYFGNAEVAASSIPKELALLSNYPNPFNPSTTIKFTLPENGHVTLKVYNVIGQQVATLFDGIAKAERFNTVTFDATQLSSGIYFSVMEFNSQRLIKKMLLTK